MTVYCVKPAQVQAYPTFFLALTCCFSIKFHKKTSPDARENAGPPPLRKRPPNIRNERRKKSYKSTKGISGPIFFTEYGGLVYTIRYCIFGNCSLGMKTKKNKSRQREKREKSLPGAFLKEGFKTFYGGKNRGVVWRIWNFTGYFTRWRNAGV